MKEVKEDFSFARKNSRKFQHFAPLALALNKPQIFCSPRKKRTNANIPELTLAYVKKNLCERIAFTF
jgi:hypothetical protein